MMQKQQILREQQELGHINALGNELENVFSTASVTESERLAQEYSLFKTFTEVMLWMKDDGSSTPKMFVNCASYNQLCMITINCI